MRVVQGPRLLDHGEGGDQLLLNLEVVQFTVTKFLLCDIRPLNTVTVDRMALREQPLELVPFGFCFGGAFLRNLQGISETLNPGVHLGLLDSLRPPRLCDQVVIHDPPPRFMMSATTFNSRTAMRPPVAMWYHRSARRDLLSASSASFITCARKRARSS